MVRNGEGGGRSGAPAGASSAPRPRSPAIDRRGSLAEALHAKHAAHPRWSYTLHRDNLLARAEQGSAIGPVPSYQSISRYLVAFGLTRRRRLPSGARAGELLAFEHRQGREVRSYEVEYINGLWHLDFHHASRKILCPDGQWLRPILLAILGDCSRLICHTLWYLTETAKFLVHGLIQAFLQRSLPRCLLTDNGGAMIAAETTQGLARLSILQHTILPYSPHQDGKQEVFWGQVEGRLFAMLEGASTSRVEVGGQSFARATPSAGFSRRTSPGANRRRSDLGVFPGPRSSRLHVVREPELDAESQRFIEDLLTRGRGPGVQFHFARGDDPSLGVRLLTALRHGDLVALQGDRPRAGARTLRAELFGQPLDLPIGPAAMARAAAVPILPLFVFRAGRARSRVVFREPITIARTTDREADFAAGIQAIAGHVEWAIRQEPFQWFCFRDLWGPLAREG